MISLLITQLLFISCLGSIIEDNTKQFLEALKGQDWSELESLFTDNTVYKCQLEPYGRGDYVGKEGLATLQAMTEAVTTEFKMDGTVSMISEETLSSIIDTTYDLTWTNSMKSFDGTGKLALKWDGNGKLVEVKEYVLNPELLISSYASETEQFLAHLIKTFNNNTEKAFAMISEDFTYNITNGLGDWDLLLTGRNEMKQLWKCMLDDSCDEDDFSGSNKNAVKKLERLHERMPPSLHENVEYEVLLSNSSHMFLDARMGPSQRYGGLVVLEFANKTEGDDGASEHGSANLMLKSEQITLYNPTGLLISEAVHAYSYFFYDGGPDA